MSVRLKEKHKIKIMCSDDIYAVMQLVLLRENKIDRKREHFWTISLDTANTILNIELVSKGSANKTIVEPMEVLSVPLQKKATKIILVHNHPSGELNPSAADKDITDLLIQCGLIMHTPVLDHLIISETSYYSFADTGLLSELEKSEKYVPPYLLAQRYEKKTAEALKIARGEVALQLAEVMKANGEPAKKIMQYTGLGKKVIERIKTTNHQLFKSNFIRKVLYVSPHQGQWKVHWEKEAVYEIYRLKEDAVKYARIVASSLPAGTCAQIKVQRADGSFQIEWTYGVDPFPPKG